MLAVTALAVLAGGHLTGRFPEPTGPSAALTVVSAAAGLCLLLYWPGRLLAGLLALRLLSGRAAGALLALALSLGTVPPVLDLIWRLTHRGELVLAAWWLLLCGLTLLCRRPPWPSPAGPQAGALFQNRATRLFAVLLGTWLCCCIFLAYWPTERAGYPVPANPHDYVKHHAILSTLHAGGLPLGNPFCARLAGEAYHYYHYFYLLPATIRLWTAGQLSIAASFGLFAAAVALACVGLIFLLARRITGGEAPAAFAAAAASVIGGLDVIPLALKRQLVVTLDAWADQPFRLHNAYTNYLWCPQHVLGLVVLLLAILLLSFAPRARWWLLLGPVLAAGLIGATAYLAVPVAIALGLYVLLDLLAPDPGGSSPWRRLAGWTVVAGLGLMLASAQLSGYLEMSSRYRDGLTTTWPQNSWALVGRLLGPGAPANLLDLPWRLLLELGAGFLACVLVGRAAYRRLWNDPGWRLLVLCSVVGLFLLAVFRSEVHRFDYGFKIGLFPVQALGAILCGCLLDPAPAVTGPWNPLGWRLRPDYHGARRTIIGGSLLVTVLIGLPVGFYEAPVTALRRFVLTPTESWAAERSAYRFLREQLPSDAVVQTHTGSSRAVLVQLAERPWGALDPGNSDVGVFRPPDPAILEAVCRDIREVGQTASAPRAYQLLRAHRVTHLFLGAEERRRWKHLDKFEEARYFIPLFREGEVAIYALAPAPPTEAGPAE